MRFAAIPLVLFVLAGSSCSRIVPDKISVELQSQDAVQVSENIKQGIEGFDPLRHDPVRQDQQTIATLKNRVQELEGQVAGTGSESSALFESVIDIMLYNEACVIPAEGDCRYYKLNKDSTLIREFPVLLPQGHVIDSVRFESMNPSARYRFPTVEVTKKNEHEIRLLAVGYPSSDVTMRIRVVVKSRYAG